MRDPGKYKCANPHCDSLINDITAVTCPFCEEKFCRSCAEDWLPCDICGQRGCSTCVGFSSAYGINICTLESCYEEADANIAEDEKKMMKSIKQAKTRKFDTGAVRDTDEGKLNYVKALSPWVIKKYVEYLGKHRQLPDGSVRDWDNWKNGIDKQVYAESLIRHAMTAWLLHEGCPIEDNHGPVTMEDALCGVIFNAMGYLYEL